MRMSVDWNNLTFKAKDLLLAVVFVGGFIFNYATNNEKLNTIIENQSETRSENKEIKARLSIIETETQLLKHRVDAWQNVNSSRR